MYLETARIRSWIAPSTPSIDKLNISKPVPYNCCISVTSLLLAFVILDLPSLLSNNLNTITPATMIKTKRYRWIVYFLQNIKPRNQYFLFNFMKSDINEKSSFNSTLHVFHKVHVRLSFIWIYFLLNGSFVKST